MKAFLSIPEEIVLLALDDSKGMIPSDKKFEVVLAASILMDLAINNRIDTDLEWLIPVSKEPMQDNVLDESLTMIFNNLKNQDAAFWISQIALRSREFIDYLISSLVHKQVLKIENEKLLWFFSKRKYPLVNETEIKEVKFRVRELIFENEIPEVRDLAIISLLKYGQLYHLVFTEEEYNKYKERIDTIAKMDLIGQAISKTISLFVSTPFTSITKSILKSKTSEEKLEILVKEMKEKFRVIDDQDLPNWLRKGTEQYLKTLAFIEKTGTSDIYYHRIKDEYFLKNFSSQGHIFGSGA